MPSYVFATMMAMNVTNKKTKNECKKQKDERAKKKAKLQYVCDTQKDESPETLIFLFCFKGLVGQGCQVRRDKTHG